MTELELDADRGGVADTLPVIVFTVRGVRMAAALSQVAELLDSREAEGRGLRLARLDDCLTVRGPEPSSDAGRTLVLRDHPAAAGIVVDTADAVTEILVDAIHELPPLLVSATASRAVWGVAAAGDDLIVLMDLDELGRAAGSGAGMHVNRATEV